MQCSGFGPFYSLQDRRPSILSVNPCPSVVLQPSQTVRRRTNLLGLAAAAWLALCSLPRAGLLARRKPCLPLLFSALFARRKSGATPGARSRQSVLILSLTGGEHSNQSRAFVFRESFRKDERVPSCFRQEHFLLWPKSVTLR